MSDETVAIAGVFTFVFGGAGAYIGLAVIRNLHDLNDRLLRNYADRRPTAERLAGPASGQGVRSLRPLIRVPSEGQIKTSRASSSPSSGKSLGSRRIARGPPRRRPLLGAGAVGKGLERRALSAFTA